MAAQVEPPKAGTPHENPYVYDASAREIKGMAAQGLVKVVDEDRSDDHGLICRMRFRRLRSSSAPRRRMQA